MDDDMRTNILKLYMAARDALREQHAPSKRAVQSRAAELMGQRAALKEEWERAGVGERWEAHWHATAEMEFEERALLAAGHAEFTRDYFESVGSCEVCAHAGMCDHKLIAVLPKAKAMAPELDCALYLQRGRRWGRIRISDGTYTVVYGPGAYRYTAWSEAERQLPPELRSRKRPAQQLVPQSPFAPQPRPAPPAQLWDSESSDAVADNNSDHVSEDKQGSDHDSARGSSEDEAEDPGEAQLYHFPDEF
jgi:hypothetical protein